MDMKNVTTNINFHKNFEILGKLGQGGFAKVFKIKSKKDDILYALKLYGDNDEEDISKFSEIYVLEKLKHPNIIKFISRLYYEDHLCLCFEYMEFDLKYYLNNVHAIDFLLIKSLMKQLLSALEFCHSKKIIHIDVKPQNILLNKKGDLKLADFGGAILVKEKFLDDSPEKGTVCYRAPERLLCSEIFDYKIDIWAAGCVFAEMVNRTILFPGDNDIDQLLKIFKILGTPNEEIWPGISLLPKWSPNFPKWKSNNLNDILLKLSDLGINLLTKMLIYDPNKRISAIQALNHNYFK